MSEYSKKRKCFIDENGQPINYLYQSGQPKINTLHDLKVEAKTMSVEESMIVGDRLNNQVEITGTASGSPSITVSGSETNIGLTLSTKGTGGLKMDNSIEIVKQGSSTPSISVSGTDADIDIEFTPKGMGILKSRWGFYEKIRSGAQTLLGAGKETINFGAFSPTYNTFPSGSLTVLDNKTFKNTSGRACVYLVSYMFGTSAHFNGQLEGAIAKYNTSSVFQRFYAVNRSRGNGSEHVHVHGTHSIYLANDESFDIQAEASDSVNIGSASSSADSVIRLSIQQIG